MGMALGLLGRPLTLNIFDDDEIDEYRRRGTPLMTVETQRPVSDADVIAFSASFENDYVNGRCLEVDGALRV